MFEEEKNDFYGAADPSGEAPAGDTQQDMPPFENTAPPEASPVYQTDVPPYNPATQTDYSAPQGNTQTQDNSGYATSEQYASPFSSDPSYTQPPYQSNDATPVMNKINYSPVSHVSDYKPASKGVKIFALIIAAVIALSSACVAGYFFGKNSSKTPTGHKVNLDLAAKPDNKELMTPAQVYEEVNKSIVGIRVYNASGAASDASGVIYSKEGYIVTNDHIYTEIGAPKFKVYLYDGSERSATYIAGDTVSDLAVLKLDDASGISPAVFGDSNELFCGENVVAIGRPSDATADSSITSGIISLTKRRVQTTSNYSARLIQTDSAINPGSSGGALVNLYGQVIGITSSKLAGVEYDAIGFAIPTTTVKRVAEQLISDGKVTNRAKLGITYTEVNSVTAEIRNQEEIGLYIASVGEDSDLYGKVSEGDMITHINGIAITNDDIVLDVIEDCVAGDTITLTIVDTRGTIKDYTVTLRANVGESSYNDKLTQLPSEDGSESSGGGTFDFPFGE